MLIEFRVENHRSLRDEQVLTTEASPKLKDADDLRPRQVDGHAASLLPLIVLYGANASGKTNVLHAFAFMQEAIISSHRVWEPDSGIPRTPFAWGSHNDAPSTFEADFLIEDCRYRYGFVVDDELILEEWLFAYPKGRKQTWFQREGTSYKFGDSLKGENRLIEDITGPNALFLSAATQNRHPQLFPIYSWFRSIYPVNLRVGRFRRRPHSFTSQQSIHRILSKTEDDLSDRDEYLLKRFRELLKDSDFGVVDIRLERNESNDGYSRTQYFLQHVVSTVEDNAWLPLDEESHGTQTMFRIALPILSALDTGSVLLVDELESSLHPLLAIQIVKLLNNPATNPKNAQLIFTTHDSNLLGTTLGPSVLRRDQVFLTEKSDEGASVVYPLTDYKPRKSENLERGYLQGRYGAIPFLGGFAEFEEEN